VVKTYLELIISMGYRRQLPTTKTKTTTTTTTTTTTSSSLITPSPDSSFLKLPSEVTA
jgi:hypothetical protein